MCGLAFVATKKQKYTGKRVYDLYTKQKSRGKDGFGYIAIQDGKIVNLKRTLTEEGVKKTIFEETAEIILLHHRYPTSTPNTLGTAHPIFVSNDELEYDYYVMHNGVISNHRSLKNDHDELGYVYNTEYIEKTYITYNNGVSEFLTEGDTKYNDSESLAIEIARYFEGKHHTIDAVGAAAVFVVTLEKGTKNVIDIAYGQNYGRSLARQDKKGWVLIASEGPGKEVPPMKFYHFNPKTFVTTESDMSMDKGYKSQMGYGSNWNGYNTTRKLISPVVNEPPTDKENEYGLVNAMYTYSEAVDSGAPFSMFTLSTTILEAGRQQVYYIPTVFLGIDSYSRPFFSDSYEWVDVEPTKDKNVEKLEELSIKYARKEYERCKIKELLEDNKIDKETYSTRDGSLELELTRLEEEMSSLGIDMEEVEDTVALAQELVDYEYSDRD